MKVKSPLKNNGKLYQIGDIIPDRELSDRDQIRLLELGVIEAPETSEGGEPVSQGVIEDIDVQPSYKIEPKNRIGTGVITDPTAILSFINSSDAENLAKIKGVGTTTAKAMVDRKSKNGNFKSIAELTQLIPGVKWTRIEIV